MAATKPEPLFILPSQLLKLFTHLTTVQGAHHRYNVIRKEIGKQKHQYITVDEISHYLDIPKQEVLKRMD